MRGIFVRFSDLIDAMLCRDPLRRPNALDLLSHPAIKAVSSNPQASPSVHDYNESLEARQELSKIVEVARTFYAKRHLDSKLTTVDEDSSLPCIGSQPRLLCGVSQRALATTCLMLLSFERCGAARPPSHVVVNEFHAAFAG